MKPKRGWTHYYGLLGVLFVSSAAFADNSFVKFQPIHVQSAPYQKKSKPKNVIQSLNPFRLQFEGPQIIRFKSSAIQKNLPLKSAPQVRVAIFKHRRNLKVTGKDFYLRFANEGWSSLSQKRKLKITCKKNEVNLNGLRGKDYLVLKPKKSQMKINGKELRGSVFIYPQPGNTNRCLVVNQLSLEWYLVGLLGMEMSSSWNMEALKAQAVAARTYALYKMKFSREKKSNLYDLESTEKDQVYSGRGSEAERSRRAVAETIGIVIAGEGKLIPAYYHSTCGGFTEHPASVWGSFTPGYNRVACPNCKKSPAFRWTFISGVKKILRSLKKYGITGSMAKPQGLLPEKMTGIHVSRRSLSGRAVEVSLHYDGGIFSIKASDFRNALGTRKVKSEWFELMSVPNEKGELKMGFLGRGYGHGVGMCQYGAKHMADTGEHFYDIIKFYYPLTDLVRVYSADRKGILKASVL